jgi:hypothetical protein
MTNSKQSTPLSRREMLKLTAAGAAGLTVLKRGAAALTPSREDFLDATTVERLADRDSSIHPPLLIDVQTHVWWRAGGVAKMNAAGEAFLKGLAGYRSAVLGHQVPIADMGRVTFFDELFLKSETDIAFLNSFGMKAAYDGVDLFPPPRSSNDSLDGARSSSGARLRRSS